MTALVTILWRAREETRTFSVFQLPGIDKPMARLLDTDLWYKTFRLQKARARLSTRERPPGTRVSGRASLRFVKRDRKDPLIHSVWPSAANELNPYE